MSQRKIGARRHTTRQTRRKHPSHKAPTSTNGESLAQWQQEFLPDDGIFSHLKFHRNTSWTPRSLVWLAVGWALSESRNVTDAFADAVVWCTNISGHSPLSTYQGFMGALTRWTASFIPLLWQQLQTRMKEWGGKFYRVDGWVPIAFDGSRSTAPRTRSNEHALCARNYGKGKTALYRKKKSHGMRRERNRAKPNQPQEPQVWITLFWHMGLRLPWCWQLGPSNSSERAHVMELVTTGDFPEKTLFCGDAGFVGYPLWSTILRHEADFLVRVGANAHLLSESKQFQYEAANVVLCWPLTKQQEPPLRLRLVRVRIGKTKVWMLTSVLQESRLSVSQIAKFYKLRWGVEVEFRGLKQTLDCGALACRNDQRVLVELHWSILAMALVELLALKEQLSRPALRTPRPTPEKRSLAQAVRAVRHCLKNPHDAPPAHEGLCYKLRAAVTDSYQRKAPKRARYRPKNPDKRALGDPHVRPLTAAERLRLTEHLKIAG